MTEKLLAEARADAEQILREANADAERIREETAAQEKVIRERIEAAATKEGEGIITRAKSSAAMEKRNITLTLRAEALDRVFSDAYEALKKLPEEQYIDLLTKLLVHALMDQIEEEAHHLELYGEEDYTVAERYEVLLNPADRKAIGEKLLTSVRRAVVGRVDLSVLEKVVIADTTVPMDGGLVLRYGDVETNCSLEMVFAACRDRMEGEINRTLFGTD